MKQDINYTIDGVIKRLQKVSLRSKDPVTCDQLRLATRALRRLVEPETADTDPIDIFIFNS